MQRLSTLHAKFAPQLGGKAEINILQTRPPAPNFVFSGLGATYAAATSYLEGEIIL